MKAANAFFDTNLLLYLLSEEPAKSEKAEELIAHGGVISVQVLNEFVSVATRKLAMTIPKSETFSPLFGLSAASGR
jgi:predicted nucleic acid-binding protein